MAEGTPVTLRYIGPDVDDGSIGVDDLLSALNGFSSAFYRLAERESLDQTQRIKVKGISQSSANIHLSILEIMHAHPEAAKIVGSAAATSAFGALGYVGKKSLTLSSRNFQALPKLRSTFRAEPILPRFR